MMIESKLEFRVLLGACLAAFSWFCVIFQFYISDINFPNVISYFTIQSNILVATSLSFAVFLPRTKIGLFFAQHSVNSAITLYIFIVLLIYNTILRGVWEPIGQQLFLDNMLHVAIPVLSILFWLFFSNKSRLNVTNVLYWMMYPFIYIIFSLVRGAVVQWYPYPFLNVYQLGYDQVFINILFMVLVFFISGFILIYVNNKWLKN